MQPLLNAVSAVVWVSVLIMGCTPTTPPADPSALASAPAPASPSPQNGQSGAVPQAGGWSQADPFAHDVQEAARFAVQTFSVRNRSRILYKDVIQAQQQVVAGLNYQLQLLVLQDGVARSAQATVWRQPDGRYKLSEWVWLDR